jgi:hypothetical protein
VADTPPADAPGPAETIRRLAAELEADWAKLGERHGDLRQLVGWFQERADVPAPPADAERLTMQALEVAVKALSLRRLLYLDARIRECSGPGRLIDL